MKMFKFLKNNKAQSTLEYAVLIGVIAAALIATQTYIKKGFQGKLKDGADSMGDQFSPRHSSSSYTINSGSESNETVSQGGHTQSTFNTTTNRSGYEGTDALSTEDWWVK